MRIEDLDEFEGLTADMVRHCLRAKAPRVILEDGFWIWNPGAQSLDKRGPILGDHGIDYSLTTALVCICAIEGRSLQSLLREINPRMRPGLPSSSEVRTHENGEGWWCARTPGGILRMGKFTPMMCFTIEALHGWQMASAHEVATWSFWPCDAHGNKVRLAADDKRRG